MTNTYILAAVHTGFIVPMAMPRVTRNQAFKLAAEMSKETGQTYVAYNVNAE
jgi:hypothetical protein